MVLLSTAMSPQTLLSTCEYLWLIRFLPKETQLLLSVKNARCSQTPLWKFTTSLLSSRKPCTYVHKRGTLKSYSMQNIIFIQQNWAKKINVLHYFLGAPRICKNNMCFQFECDVLR
jgi:hypothetical protein